MKIYFEEENTLVIEAENWLEVYAIRHWDSIYKKTVSVAPYGGEHEYTERAFLLFRWDGEFDASEK